MRKYLNFLIYPAGKKILRQKNNGLPGLIERVKGSGITRSVRIFPLLIGTFWEMCGNPLNFKYFPII